MTAHHLKIDKSLRPITLWVHPEGRVTGSIFVKAESANKGAEEPADVLNQAPHFIVLQKHEPEEIRFYNRSAIVRAEYPKSSADSSIKSHTYSCQLMMMDGSVINGIIQESLPSEFSRLYDYLNQREEYFIKLHSTDDMTYLVNKSYVTQVLSMEEQ